MELSEQQRKAVEHTGAALVVAGAGSGKTRALTAKIAHLIKNGYQPENILAITFTNKAADEMKRRLVQITGLPVERFPWVRTYHSACYQILRKHCRALNFNTPLQIYSIYHQQKLISEILIGFNIDKKYMHPVRAAISNAKNSGNPRAYFDACRRIGPFRLVDIYNKYEKELFQRNAVDFDNILMLARNLLRDNESIKNEYRKLFSYILVDEYQDSNNLQDELTQLLLGNGNLFCVGDDWQAIYGFRGSNVDNFLNFDKNFKAAEVFMMEQNFRSSDEIVATANKLINHNRHRMKKTCFSEKTGGGIEIDAFFSDADEAHWVVGNIIRLRKKGVEFSKMGILYRTKFCSLPFEQALRSAGIPYRMLGDRGFFERKEVLDINCYLSAAVFDKDDASFERVINTPKRGIGPKMIENLNRYRGEDGGLQGAVRRAVSEQILKPKVHGALVSLLSLIDEIRDMKPDQAMRTVMDRIDYYEHLRVYAKTEGDYLSRKENIEQLIFSASKYSNLLEYIEEAALIREDREEEEEASSGGGVNLSTIHASKGLEYHAVFVAGCEENLLPHWKSMESEKDLQEERRLMYVAMTRAEKFLFLSSADYRKGQYNPKSRFLDEIS
jgi:DNA helicase II / ATP-dependent DNA helicase PcrA